MIKTNSTCFFLFCFSYYQCVLFIYLLIKIVYIEYVQDDLIYMHSEMITTAKLINMSHSSPTFNISTTEIYCLSIFLAF